MMKTTVLSLFMLTLVVQPAFSQEYSNLITEDYLRSQFVFPEGSKLKYSQCKKKSYQTCTYVWGVASKKDATRVKHGLVPEGDKLMVIYAPASGIKDFQRATSVYPDAKEIAGIGTGSVWSAQRKQLSFISNKNIIVHVNIAGVQKLAKAEERATAVARHIAGTL